MSDTMDDTPSVDFGAIAENVTARLNADDAPAPEAEPVDTPEPAVEVAPQAEAADADVFDDEKVQTFDRDYVSKLREKEARYRTERNEERERWAEWNKTLDGLDTDQQGLARELVGAILQGDLARAADIIGPDELAKVLSGETSVADAAAVDPPAGEAPLTQADFDRMYAEKERAREDAAAVTAVYEQARTLGYNPDAKPGSAEYGQWVMLVQYAQANGGDLDAGHNALKSVEDARRQSIIDEFVASRSNGSPAPAPSAGSASREKEGAWLEKEGNPLNAAQKRAMERVAGNRPQVG